MKTDKEKVPTETEKYKGLNEAFEKFKHYFINEREKLLFSIGYKLGYDNTPTDTGKLLSEAREKADKLYPHIENFSDYNLAFQNSISECEREAYIKGALSIINKLNERKK